VAIDGHLNIYFNPIKIQKIIESASQMQALEQIGFLWIHEISHILREHNQRAAEGGVDPNIWNIAADMEINDSQWDGLEPPPLYPGIYPKTFRMNPGELAETYYKKLTEKSEQEIKKGLAKAMDKILEEKEKEENKEAEKDQSADKEEKNESGDNNGDLSEEKVADESRESGEENQEQEQSGDNLSEDHLPKGQKNDPSDSDNQNPEKEDSNSDTENLEKEDESNNNGAGENQESDNAPFQESLNNLPPENPNASYHELLDEGSGVHNVPRPWELESSGTEPQELDEIETEQIRIAVAKGMDEAQKAGLLPLGWERWIGKKLRPVVDWRKILRHRISRAINHSIGARIDYSFARPSRRQSVYQPLIPPSLSGNLTGQIACVVDTSGSIDDIQLNRILSEVCGILEVFNNMVTIIPCDAKAYDPIVFTRATDLRQITSMPGGGGTNMIRGIEAALGLKPIPDVVVVLTDGYTPYPEKLYKTPVLFGIIMDDLERTNMLPGSPWRDDLVVKILRE
jgi:Uncharacterized protein conserved in bacteria